MIVDTRCLLPRLLRLPILMKADEDLRLHPQWVTIVIILLTLLHQPVDLILTVLL